MLEIYKFKDTSSGKTSPEDVSESRKTPKTNDNWKKPSRQRPDKPGVGVNRAKNHKTNTSGAQNKSKDPFENSSYFHSKLDP